jgi:hypothetical protein
MKTNAISEQLNCMTKRCFGSPLKQIIAQFAFYCYLLWDQEKPLGHAAVRQSVPAASTSISEETMEGLLVPFVEPNCLLQKNALQCWKNGWMPMMPKQYVNLGICI